MASNDKKRRFTRSKKHRRASSLVPNGVLKQVMAERRSMRLLWKSPLINLEAIYSFAGVKKSRQQDEQTIRSKKREDDDA